MICKLLTILKNQNQVLCFLKNIQEATDQKKLNV